VKAAFDCYLPALIKQLGYAPPETLEARLAAWREVNAIFVYATPPDGDFIRLADAPPPPSPRRSLQDRLRR